MLRKLFFNLVQKKYFTKANVDTVVLCRKEFQKTVSPVSRHEVAIS